MPVNNGTKSRLAWGWWNQPHFILTVAECECSWNYRIHSQQNGGGSKVQVTFHRSRVQVTAPSLNYQSTQISPNLMENFTFVKGLWLGDTYCCSFTCITCNNLYSDLWKSDLYFSPAIEQRSLWGPTEPRCIQSASLQSNWLFEQLDFQPHDLPFYIL